MLNSDRHPGRLKLLVVGCRWPAETFLHRLFAGLCETGIDVTLATDAKPAKEWLSRPGFAWLPARSWQGPRWLRLTRVGRQLAGAATRAPAEMLRVRHAVNACSDRRAVHSWHRLLPLLGRKHDVVYMPWISAGAAYAPLFELGVPVIVSCRGSQIMSAPHDPHRSEFRHTLQKTFQRAAAVHCVSQSLVQQAAQFGLDPAKARVIFPAVDTRFFRPPAQPAANDGPLRVVTVGSLVWQKGHEYALAAIRRAVDAGVDVQFDVVGGGPDAQRVAYSVQDMGLSSRVNLRGAMAPEKVRDLFWQSHVCLLSSVTEGISNAVVEAMACGLPILTTDCGGMCEAVTDGVEGEIVPTRNSEALAAALIRMAGDAALRERFGRAARARAVRCFGISDQVPRWHELLRFAIAGRNEGGGSRSAMLTRSSAVLADQTPAPQVAAPPSNGKGQ